MKSFFAKLGFGRIKKVDEMERYIIFKAQRNSYIFLVAALMLWTFYEAYLVYVNHTRINLIPCLLLVVASLVQGLTQLVLSRNAVKDDEEYRDTNPLFKLILAVAVTAAIIASVGAALLLGGVRL